MCRLCSDNPFSSPPLVVGAVIDPYNELDHQRPSSMSETEYVSQMLTKVKRFAQTSGEALAALGGPTNTQDCGQDAWEGGPAVLFPAVGQRGGQRAEAMWSLWRSTATAAVCWPWSLLLLVLTPCLPLLVARGLWRCLRRRARLVRGPSPAAARVEGPAPQPLRHQRLSPLHQQG